MMIPGCGQPRPNAVNWMTTLFVCLVMSGGPLLAVECVRADMGPLLMFEAGAAAPKAPHRSIRLDAQEVTIRLGKSTYFVEAAFHFFNTGETSTEWVGFPKRVAYKGIVPGDSRIKGFDDFKWFKVWVDGRRTPVTEEPDRSASARWESGGQRRDRWMVLRAEFLGHKTTSVRCRYEAAYQIATHGRGTKTASYLFGTGAHWKGAIGSATFVIDSTDVGGTDNARVLLPTVAGSRTVLPNVVRYELGGFEPSPRDQIEIVTPYRVIPDSHSAKGRGNPRSGTSSVDPKP